jgi:hypothetical protein
MTEHRLLGSGELPQGFTYPREFLHVVQLGLTNLEPWNIVIGDQLRQLYEGLRARFPDRRFVPFARRQDNDDVVGWIPGEGVLVVHDYSSPGSEERQRYSDFWAWFRQAVEDLIEFESL